MAPHTLGRRLVDGETHIRIFGEEYERKIRVAHIDGFSAHAGQDGLVGYAKAVKGQVKNIFLVHGEEGPAKALSELLNREGFDNVHFPEWGSKTEL
jgi:metallo-beta-lactamase family protein